MENPEGFFIYDELTVSPLGDLGWQVESISWTSRDVDWSSFDAVVIRSTWDYQDAPDRFLATLETIEQTGTRLLNPVHICRWNMHKSYLRVLAERGVQTVPTQWLERLTRERLEAIVATGLNEFVVKPVVGANADDTFRLSDRPGSEWSQACRVFCAKPLMVQPFIESIVEVGEYSLIFFAGEFSHAILKTPAVGDFRVQEEHGGRIQGVSPVPAVLASAQAAIDALDESLLYARVDIAALDDGTYAVTELELIEPSLYFPYESKSPLAFAAALDSMCRG